MRTIYFSVRDYREDMRNPYGSARCHAICRHLTGTARQETIWYGAHYRAACAILSLKPCLSSYRLWRQSFALECTGCTGNIEKIPQRYKSLWKLAVRRVFSVRNQAINLKTSVLW